MRTAGILMPITSLPSPYGVGTLGQCARDFIQFLHRAGQTYWQILPICPTGYGDSPYQSFSSYAGNPYMIDFDDLKEEGLLQKEEYASLSWGDQPTTVDYGLLYGHKFTVLKTACSRISGALSEQFQKFCKDAAKELGLQEGISVAAGCGDTMANLLVAGMLNYGDLADITGTGSTICLYTKEPILDERLMNLRYSAEGWLAFGCLDSSGGAYRWFRDTLAKEESYDDLNEMAKETPEGAEKLFFYPYLVGERTLGSVYSRGMFIGLSPRHTKGHMVRSIQEGIAFEHKRTLEIMEKAGCHISCVYHSGGAAEGELWNQIKADIYQTEVKTIEENESAVLGSALLGGTAAGLYKNVLEKARELLKVKKVYYPNESQKKMYEEHFDIYKEMHDALQTSFEHLGQIER